MPLAEITGILHGETQISNRMSKTGKEHGVAPQLPMTLDWSSIGIESCSLGAAFICIAITCVWIRLGYPVRIGKRKPARILMVSELPIVDCIWEKLGVGQQIKKLKRKKK